MITAQSLFYISLLALFIPLIVSAIANLDPCPDDELLEKTAPYLAAIGIAGMIGMLWSGWLAIKPFLVLG